MFEGPVLGFFFKLKFLFPMRKKYKIVCLHSFLGDKDYEDWIGQNSKAVCNFIAWIDLSWGACRLEDYSTEISSQCLEMAYMNLWHKGQHSGLKEITLCCCLFLEVFNLPRHFSLHGKFSKCRLSGFVPGETCPAVGCWHPPLPAPDQGLGTRQGDGELPPRWHLGGLPQ